VYLIAVLAGACTDMLRRGDVLCRELPLGDVSVLAAQVTGLAGLGLAGIAERDLATLVRVKVSSSTSAVAISGDGLSVDVFMESVHVSCLVRVGCTYGT
jgi:hypothetical protein